MKILMVQGKKVLNTLLKNKQYEADFYHTKYLEDYAVTAYQILMKYLDYKTVPIFGCIFDRFSSFHGTHATKGSVILELDVPDELVTIQYFYGWLDFQSSIFYLKPKPETAYHQQISYSFDPDLTHNSCMFTVQAVLPYIKPEWFVCAYKYDHEFIQSFSGDVRLEECLLNKLMRI